MLKKKLANLEVKAYYKVKDLLASERGDFISALILLGIVVLLSGVFIGFKDQIVAKVQEIMNNFTIT